MNPPSPPTAAVPDDTWTIRRVLEWTSGYLRERGSESPRLEAEVLLAHARGCARIQLYTAYDEPLSEDVRGRMRELVRRRAAAEPVAYLVGHREFFGLDFHVTPDVLIPRPETETLVVEALARVRGRERARVLDLGTGSGCIAVAVAANHPGAQVTAVDVSQRALAIAAENVARHGVGDRVRLVCGDLFDPLAADEQFDLVLSNPPYVRRDELEHLQPEVRLHEPRLALVAGADGLELYRRIANGAPQRLAAGGALLVECSPEQGPVVGALFSAAAHLSDVRIVNDLAGMARLVIATKGKSD